MSDSSTVLTTDGIPLEERITAQTRAKRLLCLLYIVLFIFFCVGFFIAPQLLIFVLISCGVLIYTTCKSRSEIEIIINNSNRTMILVSKKVCKCCNSPQKIIDLNKIAKMNNFKIYYKDGSNEDVNLYFSDLNDESVEKCKNFLKKYIVIDNRNLEAVPSAEMAVVGGCPVITPDSSYNSNNMTNQINNPNIPPNYNPNIPANYNPNIPPNYNLNIPPNYIPNISPNYNPNIPPNYNPNIPPNYNPNIPLNNNPDIPPGYNSGMA